MLKEVEERMQAPLSAAAIAARLERLPVTRRLSIIRLVIGAATFFDAFTVLAIAFAMPVLMKEWSLTKADAGLIISSGYLGQLIGALFFGWLAERVGRLRVLLFTIILFVVMGVACIFATGAATMIAFRFLQGIGTGGEVPVASAYVNELVGANRRGRFFLIYEVIFPIGLMVTGAVGAVLVPHYGWKAMFIVGIVPSILLIPLRFLMPESPRWLASRGRLAEADTVVRGLEQSALDQGLALPEPVIVERPVVSARGSLRELFSGIYLKRTLMIWVLWFGVYVVNNGMITWMPTLYREVFKLPLQTSLTYGFITSAAGVVASIVCALYIDRVGRRKWYAVALVLGTLPLAALAASGTSSAVNVLILVSLTYALVQTVAFSLYLYSAELFPTRLRAFATGCGSAWLRLGSSAGPLIVGYLAGGYGIGVVFGSFACVLVTTALVTWLFATETAGMSLEELSP